MIVGSVQCKAFYPCIFLLLLFHDQLMIPKIKVKKKKKMEQAKYPTRSRGIIVKYSKRGYVTVPFVLLLFSDRGWIRYDFQVVYLLSAG